MALYLLDTNHLSAALNDEPGVREKLRDLRLRGDLYHELRRRGRALSQVDIMLAAMAAHLSATIVTTDRDFEALAGIRLESWLPR